MHVPFQMFVHNNVSLQYLVEALPNLIETFISHFIYCFISYKCKDITVCLWFSRGNTIMRNSIVLYPHFFEIVPSMITAFVLEWFVIQK